jgi:amino-acid N-acetyltransferase
MQTNPPPNAAATRALLASCALPTADLQDEDFLNFIYIGQPDSPIAVVGVEVHGGYGLLRSLAVREDQRGSGLSIKLVNAIEKAAHARGVAWLYLLTNTAGTLFERLGYKPMPRDDAPKEIQSTQEFTALCPASAVLMGKQIAA